MVALVIMALAGAALLVMSAIGVPMVFGILTFGGDFWQLGLLLLANLGVNAAGGVVLLLLAKRMAGADRVARGVSYACLAALAAAMFFAEQRGPAPVLIGLGCLATIALLALPPNVNAFFRNSPRHGAEAVSVVVAETLIAFWGGIMLLNGLFSLPLVGIDLRLAGLGVGLAAVGGAALWANRGLRLGQRGWRLLVTLGTAAYVVLLLVFGQLNASIAIPFTLAACVVGLLWLPADAKAHFNGVRPAAPTPGKWTSANTPPLGPSADTTVRVSRPPAPSRPAPANSMPVTHPTPAAGPPKPQWQQPTAPATPRTSRRPAIALIAAAAILAAGAVGAALVFVLNDSGGSDPVEASGDEPLRETAANSPSPQSTTRAPQPVFDPEEPGSAAVWSGDIKYPSGGGNYNATLRLKADRGGSVSGQVRMTNSASATTGTWQVKGEGKGGEIVLNPGAWITQPDGDWKREGFRLTLGADGRLTGRSVPEQSGGSTGDVGLSLIAKGAPDADAVAADWRVALVVPDDDAETMLKSIRAQDGARRDGLTGSWVPQISSGCRGLQTATGPLTASSILARSARYAQEHGAITVAWEDVGTTSPDACPTSTMWLVLVAAPSTDAAGALDWCSRAGMGKDDCAARYLVARGQSGTDIEYQD